MMKDGNAHIQVPEPPSPEEREREDETQLLPCDIARGTGARGSGMTLLVTVYQLPVTSRILSISGLLYVGWNRLASDSDSNSHGARDMQ